MSRLPSWSALLLAGAAAGDASGLGESPLETRLFFIGDGGASESKSEPVLRALARDAAEDAAASTLVFLGDNAYPRGLPPEGAHGRRDAERRLEAQINAVRRAGGRALFVPGNHDWDREGNDGWNAVRRQAAFVTARGGAGVLFRPQDGCPGPDVVDLDSRVRLVALDTQWWLHVGPRPLHPDSGCPADSEDEVKAALHAAVSSAGGRRVIVVAHHPLASGGKHGGHFTWVEHVFPLRDWKPWLWLPLPGLGSAYPLARNLGATAQDLTSAVNRRMCEALVGALKGTSVLAWVAGHDHNLQVLEADVPAYVIVSGAGVFGRRSPVRRLAATRFAADAAGYVRLVVPAAGPARLSVRTVSARGDAAERYASNLEER